VSADHPDDPPAERTELERAFAEVIASTEPGDVMAYGEVATEAGYPGRARAVGAFLAHHGDGLPWWRIVTASGRLVPGNEDDHARRLRAEGIEVRDGHVRRPRG
jgi:methylated-DNA-protein-cysteine methyltransferase-like protein